MKKNLLTLDIILSKEIKYLLETQNYQPMDKLPSERALAELFQVQRQTIRSALHLLLQEKVIFTKSRSGYFVAPKRILQPTRHFSMNGFSEQSNQTLHYDLILFRKLHADFHLSGKMLLPENTTIYKITKLYFESDTPLYIDNSYIPEDIYPNLTRTIVTSGTALELLQTHKQLAISKSNQKITLIYANEKEAELLKVSSGTPLMKYKGLMYDKQGRLVIFFENIMLIDRFAFIRDVGGMV